MTGSSRAVLLRVLPAFVLALTLGGPTLAENSLTVVYHHVLGDSAGDLQPQGGFSAHVKFNGRTILFDTGGERTALVDNLRKLEFDPFGLDAVIISHNHWDHVYGLAGLSSMTGENPPVYVPASAQEGIQQQNPRARVVAVQETLEIFPGAWIVGPLEMTYLGNPIAEQALILETESGLVVVVGCSHPGIVRVIESVQDRFPGGEIALVCGGFHLGRTPEADLEAIAASLRELGVSRIAPTHCTGDLAIDVFRRTSGLEVLSCNLGDTIAF